MAPAADEGGGQTCLPLAARAPIIRVVTPCYIRSALPLRRTRRAAEWPIRGIATRVTQIELTIIVERGTRSYTYTVVLLEELPLWAVVGDATTWNNSPSTERFI